MRGRLALGVLLAALAGGGALLWYCWPRPPALTAPGAAADPAPLLQRLDACFARRSVDDYLAAFAFDDRRQRELLAARLRQLFAGAPLHRTSAALGGMLRIGERGVVLVEHQYRREPAGEAAREAIWLVLAERQGELLPTAWYTAAAPAADPRQPFRCPACNYEVGGVDGWLCVPGRPDRAEAIESATFALLGTDVRCDVGVEVGTEPAAAAAVAAAMGKGLEQLLPGARGGAVEPWLPPSLAGLAPPALTAARLRLDAGDGQEQLLHIVCLGELRHSLIVSGQPASLRRCAPAIAALLASYRLLQTDADLARLAAAPLRVHQGSSLDGQTYHNELYRLSCTGPEPWPARLCGGGAAFAALWRCPQQSGRMHLCGYLPPPGLPQWRRGDADAWLDDLCRRGGLSVLDDGGWCDDGGDWQRTLVLRGETPPARRLLRLQLRPQLLVVLDGHTVLAGDEELLREAFASLRLQ